MMRIKLRQRKKNNEKGNQTQRERQKRDSSRLIEGERHWEARFGKRERRLGERGREEERWIQKS
jgi:hypothetical protein